MPLWETWAVAPIIEGNQQNFYSWKYVITVNKKKKKKNLMRIAEASYKNLLKYIDEKQGQTHPCAKEGSHPAPTLLKLF